MLKIWIWSECVYVHIHIYVQGWGQMNGHTCGYKIFAYPVNTIRYF